MNVQALSLPLAGIALDQLAIWNAVISHAGHMLPLAHKSAGARFERCEAPAGNTLCCRVQFGAGLSLLVAVSEFPFQTVFGTPFNVEDLPSLPEGLRDALLEGILAMVWDVLPDHRLRSYAVQAIAPCASLIEGQGLAWFDVRLAGLYAQEIAFCVGIAPERLSAVVASGTLAPRRVWPALAQQIQEPVTIGLGRVALSAQEAGRLACGDVIVLAQAHAERAHVRVRSRVIAFERHGQGWVVSNDAPLRAEGDETLEDESAQMQGHSGDLEVQLDFDLAHKLVPLSEIETWQPGSLVALDVPALDQGLEVTIRAGGRAIGLGDLVRLDDRLAVRVNRLFLNKEAVR